MGLRDRENYALITGELAFSNCGAFEGLEEIRRLIGVQSSQTHDLPVPSGVRPNVFRSCPGWSLGLMSPVAVSASVVSFGGDWEGTFLSRRPSSPA